MNRGLVNPQLLTDIADAIRYKLATDNKYKLAEMPNAINSIEGGSSAIDYAILPASGFNMEGKISNIFFLNERPNNELRDTESIFSLPGGERAWSYTQGTNFFIYPDKNCNYEFYGSMANTFNNCTNLVSGAFTSNAITNMDWAYSGCGSLIDPAVCSETITNMAGTYNYCYRIKGPAACGNKVENMDYAYQMCYNLNTAYVAKNVKSMNSAFYSCHGLKDAVINNNVIYASNAYRSCTSMLNTFNEVPDSVKEMQYCFQECSSLINKPVCGNNVTHFYYTYYNDRRLTGEPVCGPNVQYFDNCYFYCWNLTGNAACGDEVLNMAWTYHWCNNLNGSPACGKKVNNMAYAYAACTNLTGNAVCGDNVINMYYAYQGCTHLNGSPACGVNVRDMGYAYDCCYNLIGPPVCGNNVTSMQNTYNHCYNLTGQPVVGPNVRTMYCAYYNCGNLNGVPVFSSNIECRGIYYAYWNCSNLSGGDVYLLHNISDSYGAFENALYNFNTNNRLNFYVLYNRRWDNTFKRNTNSYSILGIPITWTLIAEDNLPNGLPNMDENYPVSSGYYNDAYNMYVYQCAGTAEFRSVSWSRAETENICIYTSLHNIANSNGSYLNQGLDPIKWYYDSNNKTEYVFMASKKYLWNYNSSHDWRNCFNLQMNLTELYGNGFSFSNVRYFNYAFENCYNITGHPFALQKQTWNEFVSVYKDCHNITGTAACGEDIQSFQNCYKNCYNLEHAYVGDNIINMDRTFQNCYNLRGNGYCQGDCCASYDNCFNLDGKPIIMDKGVTNFRWTFFNCQNLSCGIIPPCYDSYGAFQYCYNISYVNDYYVQNSNLTYANYMFYGCNNLSHSVIMPKSAIFMDHTFTDADTVPTIYIQATRSDYFNNAFTRNNYNTKMNIVFFNYSAYNYARQYGSWVCNSTMSADSNTPDISVFTRESELDANINNVVPVRYCYNELHNIYFYCTE